MFRLSDLATYFQENGHLLSKKAQTFRYVFRIRRVNIVIREELVCVTRVGSVPAVKGQTTEVN